MHQCIIQHHPTLSMMRSHSYNISQVEQLLKLWPSARLVALGGATEVTVWSNAFQLQRVDPAWRSVPYGKPIWNHQSLGQNRWHASLCERQTVSVDECGPEFRNENVTSGKVQEIRR